MEPDARRSKSRARVRRHGEPEEANGKEFGRPVESRRDEHRALCLGRPERRRDHRAARGGPRRRPRRRRPRLHAVYEELRGSRTRQLRASPGATPRVDHRARPRGLPQALARPRLDGATVASTSCRSRPRAMRQIVVDAARARDAAKARRRRSGRAALDGSSRSAPRGRAKRSWRSIARSSKLARIDPELERLVELRFFAGLSLEEIRDLTGTPERTLKRSWRVARALLVQRARPRRPPAVRRRVSEERDARRAARRVGRLFEELVELPEGERARRGSRRSRDRGLARGRRAAARRRPRRRRRCSARRCGRQRSGSARGDPAATRDAGPERRTDRRLADPRARSAAAAWARSASPSAPTAPSSSGWRSSCSSAGSTARRSSRASCAERQILARLDHPASRSSSTAGWRPTAARTSSSSWCAGGRSPTGARSGGCRSSARLRLLLEVARRSSFAHRNAGRPPRPQAFERPRHRRGHGQAARLRHRQAARRRRRAAPTTRPARAC